MSAPKPIEDLVVIDLCSDDDDDDTASDVMSLSSLKSEDMGVHVEALSRVLTQNTSKWCEDKVEVIEDVTDDDDDDDSGCGDGDV